MALLNEEFETVGRDSETPRAVTAIWSRAIKCQVESRAKATESVKASLDRREKALRKRNKKRFESFSEIFDAIHDLVGVRIILEYPDHMHGAIQFIKRSFREERANRLHL